MRNAILIWVVEFRLCRESLPRGFIFREVDAMAEYMWLPVTLEVGFPPPLMEEAGMYDLTGAPLGVLAVAVFFLSDSSTTFNASASWGQVFFCWTGV